MAKTFNQKQKLLYLKKIFEERTDEEHGLTLAEISAALEAYDIKAERKALYDDINALREFDMDIEKRGSRTVTYHLVNRDFELAELKLLVDAVQGSKFITHKKSSTLIKKIEGLASRYEARELQRQVFVAGRIKTMNESIYYVVDDIHRAISANRQIAFQYYEWNAGKEKQLRRGGKTYQVSPWALTWDDENYYLIAYDEESGIIKHYRVDKMLNLSVTGEPRQGEKLFANFDMAIYSKRTFGMHGGAEKQVTLRCQNSMAGIIIDRFGQDVMMYQIDDEHFDVVVRVFMSDHFLTWIMNFRDRVKIMAPEDVKNSYINLAQEVIKSCEENNE